VSMNKINGVEIPMVSKSLFLAYLLWLVLGIFGAHRWYLGIGSIFQRISFTITLGHGLIGWLMDACRIPGWVSPAYIYLDVPGRHEDEIFRVEVNREKRKELAKALLARASYVKGVVNV